MEVKSFSEIIGQDMVVGYLKKAISNNKTATAYLFAGIKGIGKTSTALAFALSLNCINPANGNGCRSCQSCRKMIGGNHPDLSIIGLEDKKESIVIEQIRNINREISFPPALDGYRIIIIDPAERMTVEATNAFLKTLEEPPSNNIFILNVRDTGEILPTIISRCQKVYFKPINEREIVNFLINNKDVEKERAGIAARLSEGSIGQAERFVQDDFFSDRVNWIKMLYNVINNSFESLFDIAQKFITKRDSKDNRINLMLGIWKSFYRDMLLIKHGGRIDFIINSDFKDQIEKASSVYTIDGLIKSISIIAGAEHDLKANLNTLFLIEKSLFRLKRALNSV